MISGGIQQLRDALAMAGFEGMTERQRDMHRASAYYHGRQYDHLPDWDDPAMKDEPIRSKAPRYQYRLIKVLTDQLISYVLGQDENPTFMVENAESDDVARTVEMLAGNDPRGLNLMGKMWETTRLAFLHSAVAVGFVKRTTSGGVRYSTKVLQADMLNPTFAEMVPSVAAEYDLADDDLAELDQYWYRYHEDPVTGETWYTLHRRVWELERTVEFEPIDLRAINHPDQIQWTEARVVTHDLGLVPVEYIRPFPLVNSAGGIPLFEDAEFDLADSINYAMSQLDRGIEYNQEPTQVFHGVNVSNEDSLKKAAHKTWAINSDGGDAGVELLELQGEGQRVALEYVDKLRDVLYDVAQLVRHDPQQAANVMSGTAMKRMLIPTIARTHVVRPRIGRPFARLLHKAAKADGVISTSEDIKVVVGWPHVVEQSENDKTQQQNRTITAEDAGYLTFEDAVASISQMYGIENPKEYAAELQRSRNQGGTAETLPPLEEPDAPDEG